MKRLMVILERFLDSDGPKLRIGGIVTRDVAHYQGVPHGAVEVAVVVAKRIQNQLTPHILLHWRSKWRKIAPETWDVCGGHIQAEESLFTETVFADKQTISVWTDQERITELFDATALREINEEFRIIARPDFRFEAKHLRCFGGPGSFEYGFDDPSSKNKEFSAFYGAFVPSEILTVETIDDPKRMFRVGDSVGFGGQQKEVVTSEIKLISLPDLVLDYTRNPDSYADGIARVLSRVACEPGTLQSLSKFLES